MPAQEARARQSQLLAALPTPPLPASSNPSTNSNHNVARRVSSPPPVAPKLSEELDLSLPRHSASPPSSAAEAAPRSLCPCISCKPPPQSPNSATSPPRDSEPSTPAFHPSKRRRLLPLPNSLSPTSPKTARNRAKTLPPDDLPILIQQAQNSGRHNSISSLKRLASALRAPSHKAIRLSVQPRLSLEQTQSQEQDLAQWSTPDSGGRAGPTLRPCGKTTTEADLLHREGQKTAHEKTAAGFARAQETGTKTGGAATSVETSMTAVTDGEEVRQHVRKQDSC